MVVVEAEARMEEEQCKDRNGDHAVQMESALDTLRSTERKNLRRVANHEVQFIPHDAIPPSPGHFNYSIDAANQNAGKCDQQGDQKPFKLPRPPQRSRIRVDLAFVPQDTQEILQTQTGENAESEDLERQTGNHKVVANVDDVLGVGSSSSTTTRSLQDKRKEVAGYEDVCVPGRA